MWFENTFSLEVSLQSRQYPQRQKTLFSLSGSTLQTTLFAMSEPDMIGNPDVSIPPLEDCPPEHFSGDGRLEGSPAEVAKTNSEIFNITTAAKDLLKCPCGKWHDQYACKIAMDMATAFAQEAYLGRKIEPNTEIAQQKLDDTIKLSTYFLDEGFIGVKHADNPMRDNPSVSELVEQWFDGRILPPEKPEWSRKFELIHLEWPRGLVELKWSMHKSMCTPVPAVPLVKLTSQFQICRWFDPPKVTFEGPYSLKRFFKAVAADQDAAEQHGYYLQLVKAHDEVCTCNRCPSPAHQRWVPAFLRLDFLPPGIDGQKKAIVYNGNFWRELGDRLNLTLDEAISDFNLMLTQVEMCDKVRGDAPNQFREQLCRLAFEVGTLKTLLTTANRAYEVAAVHLQQKNFNEEDYAEDHVACVRLYTLQRFNLSLEYCKHLQDGNPAVFMLPALVAHDLHPLVIDKRGPRFVPPATPCGNCASIKSYCDPDPRIPPSEPEAIRGLKLHREYVPTEDWQPPPAKDWANTTETTEEPHSEAGRSTVPDTHSDPNVEELSEGSKST